MKFDQLEVSISKMSEDELREFIFEIRRAQTRYKESIAVAKPKRATIVPHSGKSKEETLQDILKGVDPDVLTKILKDKGVL